MTLLGFADDVLDLPWRYKLILPPIASLPLLASYTGGTSIVIPKFLGAFLCASDGHLTSLGWLVDPFLGLATVDTNAAGAVIELGIFYMVYMALLATFATNAINIYAGINGLEAGQSAVISVAIITANIIELANGASNMSPHVFSALLGLPFLGVTLGVLMHNMHPARAFVGDTFCYFAGMTFAVHAILGHFSKTLLLFFLPQVINFIYSLPQLFKVYPCPRHRLPDFDSQLGLMRPSTFEFVVGGGKATTTTTTMSSTTTSITDVSKGTTLPIPLVKKRRSSAANITAAATVSMTTTPTPLTIVRRDNMTLINLLLRVCGPLHERTATNALLVLQAICCAVALIVRAMAVDTSPPDVR